MIPSKRIFSFLLLLSALLFNSACQNRHAGLPEPSSNLLGIVKHSEGSFKQASPTSAVLSTTDITDRRDISGDSVSLLWGLIEIQDY